MECELFQAFSYICLNQLCIVTVCVDLSQVEKLQKVSCLNLYE